MGFFTTANQDEMEAALTQFSTVTNTLFGSHSYAAGFYESTIVDLLARLPKRQQRDAIEDIRRATLRMQRQLQAKLERSSAV